MDFFIIDNNIFFNNTMKQISILFMCLFCSMLTMAQTTESITINGASSEGFITNISFSGNDAMVTYENGTQ